MRKKKKSDSKMSLNKKAKNFKDFIPYTIIMNVIKAGKLEILSSNQQKTGKIEMIEGIKRGLIEDMKSAGKKMIKREDIQEKIADERKTKNTAYPRQMTIGGKIEEIKE